MTDRQKAIREKAALLEAYSEVIEVLEQRLAWYENYDEDGKLITDETDVYTNSRRLAFNTVIESVMKSCMK